MLSMVEAGGRLEVFRERMPPHVFEGVPMRVHGGHGGARGVCREPAAWTTRASDGASPFSSRPRQESAWKFFAGGASAEQFFCRESSNEAIQARGWEQRLRWASPRAHGVSLGQPALFPQPVAPGDTRQQNIWGSVSGCADGDSASAGERLPAQGTRVHYYWRPGSASSPEQGTWLGATEGVNAQKNVVLRGGSVMCSVCARTVMCSVCAVCSVCFCVCVCVCACAVRVLVCVYVCV